MAFVTCEKFNRSQEEQDDKMISAEDGLLDKSSGVGGGKLTVEKLKENLAGDVRISIVKNSGIKGSGTKRDPLSLNKIRLVDASGKHALGYIIGE
ncbi:hypothetical protein A6B43_00255 [Vespertiliibacter pulmonis]|uniref:Uncharacterized protein n=1 Tax=Vespertiliibacter pulmonis TaxID=1443036 RepID=A0A3N4VXE3_9PAST|nr:hypothetical protein [Vespertiliibacter pulmonis]QLB20078.1 hypothetical protein A6B43_00255 [Vespertiliibacter pulmonis]RPE86043.1 hypothetical protein EDC46_0434 [Vespertiliibacter pulmonis]